MGLVRQLAMPEQVNDLLVADLPGEFVDVVSGVDEDSLLAAHVAEGGGVGNDTFESFGDDGHGSGLLGGWILGCGKVTSSASSCG